MSYILALTAFINVRIFEAAALYIYITNFTEHSVHTRRIDTHWHSSSIMLPQDHFNDVIAQWEVNRNIFMVHLRRRILNLPTLRFQLRAIKIATKKRLLMLKEPLEEPWRGRTAPRGTLTLKGTVIRKVGCLLNLPLKGTELILRNISVLYVTFQRESASA